MYNGFIIVIFVFLIYITLLVIIIIGGGDWSCVTFILNIELFYILRPCLSQLALVLLRHIASKLWLLLLLVYFQKIILVLHHELRFADFIC